MFVFDDLFKSKHLILDFTQQKTIFLHTVRIVNHDNSQECVFRCILHFKVDTIDCCKFKH